MRIDAYNQIQQVYGAKKIGKADERKTVSSSFRDQLILSSAARDAATARQAVANAPDVREDLVSSLKQRIDSGSYEVSTDDFAAKLLEKHSRLF